MSDISITLNTVVKRTDKGTTSVTFRATGYQVSSSVFAIEVLPRSADFTAPNYRFSHVCSPQELVEFPEGVPGDCCYFRTDTIELIFDTPDPIGHVSANMQADIANLVRELIALEEATPQATTVTFDETNV